MTEKGWEVTYDETIDGVRSEPGEDQMAAYRADDQACGEKFEKENPPRTLTDADYRKLYQEELETMKCLEKQGFPPLSEPISMQQYVEEYRAGGTGPSWQAYQALGPTPRAEVAAEMNKVCPQPGSDWTS